MNPEVVWWAKMAQRDQAMAMEAGRSEEKEYVAAVPSKKNLPSWISVKTTRKQTRPYRARKTKTLVQTPGRVESASTPKASKAVNTIRTVVQP